MSSASIFNKFIKYVDEGREGANRGIPMGYPKFDRFLRGIQKKKYYLVGANTGVGKTAFVDEAFVLNPYEWIKSQNAERAARGEPPIKEKLKIFYYSFEIDSEQKIAKWVSYKIFKDTGKKIDPEHIVGMDMTHEKDEANKLSDENYNLILTYREYFDELFDCIQFEDVAINPTGIYNQVKEYCKSTGKDVTMTRKVEGKEKNITYYKQNDSGEYVIVIVDHMGLVKHEKGADAKKSIIDKLDSYLIQLRNYYRIIPVGITQFNRELGDTNRQRFKELTPQLEDFKDTGNTQESANVVLALFHPKRYNLTNYLAYNLTTSTNVDGGSESNIDVFRAIFILKNRGGKDGMKQAFRFLGICGHFEEIPRADEFAENPHWYGKLADFNKPFHEHIDNFKQIKGK